MPYFNSFQRGLLVITLISLTMCTSKKKFVYFQSNSASTESTINKNYTPIFKKDDLLSITVMGLDKEAVEPFNIPLNYINTNNVGGYAQGAPTPPGYLIDGEGFIDFPVIGKIKIGGLTRVEAMELLKSRLVTYINKPTVNIRILNYKITVLGEVRNPGTFTIPNERVTLPEALGIAGDLLITGLRTNVLLIRDEDGKKTEYRVDLTSKQAKWI